MLGYFPVPYPDELIYSVISRYKLHQGIVSDRQIVNDLFGSRNVAAVVDFPGHLLDLEQKTYHLTHITADQWLTKHSLYPAYKYFLPADRNEKIVQSVLTGKAWDVHTRTGVAASNIKVPKFLRLCKHCYRDELELFGEPYWHRLHQLSGVMVCPIHKEYLYETDALFRPHGKYEFFPAINASLVRKIPLNLITKQKQKLMQLSKNIDELINLDESYSVSHDQWSMYYWQLAESKIFTVGKRVNHDEISIYMENYWSSCLLNIFGLATDNSYWVKNLFRKHRKSFHYLYHLAVWQAMGEISPQDAVVCACHLVPKLQKQEASEFKSNHPALEMKRKEWKLAIAANPSQGIKWLRTCGGFCALYAWLYKNDRYWLQRNKPDSVYRYEKRQLIDWKRRDNELMNHLKYLKEVGGLNNKSGRCSMSWLIQQSGRRSLLEKNQDKLPCSLKFISRLAESPESYRKRRIDQAIEELFANHQSLQTWVILRRAGIRKEYQTPSIIRYINRLKRKLSLGVTDIIPQST